MRHLKHKNSLGLKKEHRIAVIANLCSALLRHGRIQTTLKKAKALRPFVESIVTLAKKAFQSDLPEQKLHFRRLAIARVRDKEAVKMLFDGYVQEFSDRLGGYTRIYKLLQRRGDASPVGLIELLTKNGDRLFTTISKDSESLNSTPPVVQESKEESTVS